MIALLPPPSVQTSYMDCSQADEKVRLQKAEQAADKYRASSRFGDRQRRRAMVTKDSKLMEERNAVVSAAAKMMLRAGVEASEEEAYARAQEGYIRRHVWICQQTGKAT